MSLLDKEETVVINADNPHYVELAQSTGRHVLTVLIQAAILFVNSREQS